MKNNETKLTQNEISFKVKALSVQNNINVKTNAENKAFKKALYDAQGGQIPNSRDPFYLLVNSLNDDITVEVIDADEDVLRIEDSQQVRNDIDTEKGRWDVLGYDQDFLIENNILNSEAKVALYKSLVDQGIGRNESLEKIQELQAQIQVQPK